MAEQNTKYLDYLDKEMTIMGILSTFAVAMVALFLQQIGTAEPTKNSLFYSLWQTEFPYIITGSVGVLVSAIIFYLQRADLAWHYGRLAQAIDKASGTSMKGEDALAAGNKTNIPEKLLDEADSWETWIPYFWAFKFLWIGLALYLWAFLDVQLHLKGLWLLVPITWTVVFLLMGCFQRWLHLRYWNEEEPWHAWLEKKRPSSSN
jgi:hypothetical protein